MPRTIIVFDLDDTLYSERQFALSGFAAAASWARRELGVSGVAETMRLRLDEGHLGALFPMALKHHAPDHTPAHLTAFIDAYKTHVPVLDLYEDATEVLADLETKGPLGLITDGDHSVQTAKVRALGLAPRFAHVIYTHALGPDRAFAKPHRRAFELMQQVLRQPGDRMVYVGDNPAKDFIAPNAMGWTSVQVRRPHRIHHRAETAENGAPHHAIDKLTELPKLLPD